MKPQEYIEALNAGAEVTLPSGLEVRVRPIDSRVLLNQEYTSDLMVIIREKLLGELPSQDTVNMPIGELYEANQKTLVFYEEVAKLCVIEPKLVDKPVDQLLPGEFPIKLISQTDLMFFGQLINLPLVELRTFCSQQTERVELILRGESQPVQSSDGTGDRPDGVEYDGGQEFAPDQPLVGVLSPE